MTMRLNKILSVLLLLPSFALAETPFAGVVDIGGEMFVYGGGFSTFSLNQTTDTWEAGFMATKALTFDRICFRVGTSVGNPPAYKVGVKDMATSGNPIRAGSTFKTGSGECSGTYDPAGTGDNNTAQCVTTTGTTCAVAAGEMFTIVVAPTGTPDGSNYLQVADTQSGMWANDDTIRRYNNEWSVTNDNNTTIAERDTWPIGWLYNSTSNVYEGNPFKAYHQNYFEDANNPDEYCNRIYYTLPTGCTYKLAGLSVFWGKTLSSTASFVARLLDSSGTVLDDVTLDSDQTRSVDASNPQNYYFDDSLDTLSSATEYWGCIKNTSAVNGYIAEVEMENNNQFSAYSGGTAIYKGTRNNSTGAPSPTNTRRMAIQPILDSITCSASSGGRSQNLKTGLGGL